MKYIDECLGILSDKNYSSQIATVLTPNSYDKVEWCIARGIKKYYVLNLMEGM